MSFEFIKNFTPTKVETLSDYFFFCKSYFKPKSVEEVKNYLYKKKSYPSGKMGPFTTRFFYFENAF